MLKALTRTLLLELGLQFSFSKSKNEHTFSKSTTVFSNGVLYTSYSFCGNIGGFVLLHLLGKFLLLSVRFLT